MSDLTKWRKKIPNWVWLSLIPGFGGLAISYAGNKVNNKTWIVVGIGITFFALLFSSQEIAALIWIVQVVTACYLSINVSLKSSTQKVSSSQFLATNLEKIDVNACSKHELVYELGLPITYANDIESLRNEGYIFTHLEELSEIAGLPESYLKKLSPIVVFGYDPNKELEVSWRRLNGYTEVELIESGMDIVIAQKIVEERQKNGLYRSLIDVKNRTGLPLRSYWDLI